MFSRKSNDLTCFFSFAYRNQRLINRDSALKLLCASYFKSNNNIRYSVGGIIGFLAFTQSLAGILA